MRLGKFLAVALLLCPVLAHATVCPTGYGYLKVFAVPVQASTLTSFAVPLLFNGATPVSGNGLSTPTSYTLTDLKVTGSGGKIQSSGNDIVFCDAPGGNLLNFERVYYDGTTGKAEFYAQRTLSSSAVTYIYMYYGKASDSDHSSAAATWSNYGFVMHAPDGSTLTLADSTGTNTITNSGSTAVAGQIAGAMLVSATGPKTASVADNASIKPTAGMTYSAWVYPTANVSVGIILGKNDGNGYDMYLGQGGSNTVPNCQISSASNALLRGTASLSLNAWHYVVCTASSTPSNSTNFKMYVDGVEVTSLSVATFSSNITTSTVALGIGKRTSGSALNGEARVDEVRISTGMQTAAQVAADYLAQLYPTAFAQMLDGNTPAGMSTGGNCVPQIINHALVPNTDQANYPLTVHGVYPWMADVAHGGYAVTGNSGKDIRFYSNSGCTAALDFQRVYWTNTTGEELFYVRIPTASHTTDTTVYVRIGSTSDTSDLSTNWRASYNVAGFYAGSDPLTLGTADSGVGGLTLSCGIHAFAALTPVGGGFYFDNTQADSATCGNSPGAAGDTLAAHGYPVGSSAGHIRMWARNTPLTSSGGSANDVNIGGYGKANSTGQRGFQTNYRATQITGMATGVMANGDASVSMLNSGTTPTYTQDLGWHVYDFDQPTNGATFGSTSFYIDGNRVTAPYYGASGSSSTVLNTADAACCTSQSEVRMGRDAAHGVGYFTGYVGQFEVTNVSQSADLVQTRINNESTPSFYSWGTATPFAGGGSTSAQPVVIVIM